MNNRVNRLRNMLADNGIDAVFITGAENRFYLSGFDGSAGYLLISEKKAVLATDFRYTEQALKEAPDFEILRITSKVGDWFPGLIKDSGAKKLGFEADNITYDFHEKLQNGTELVPVKGLVENLRAVKEPEEIDFITEAVEIADIAYEKVAGNIEAGMTELHVAWELEKALREKGSEAIPFEIIVASGPRAALPHARPTERVIESGDAVVIDMGARYKGYTSDLSRSLCIGTPGDTFIKVYHTVLEAQLAASDTITGAMSGRQADSIARSIIKKAGYGEAFGHSLGHGVGLAAHELPVLGPNSEGPLQDNMVFTVEPGIYLSGWGGVRIEDTVVMKNGRVQVLSKARKVKYD